MSGVFVLAQFVNFSDTTTIEMILGLFPQSSNARCIQTMTPIGFQTKQPHDSLPFMPMTPYLNATVFIKGTYHYVSHFMGNGLKNDI
jgi:hypothetical protein